MGHGALQQAAQYNPQAPPPAPPPEQMNVGALQAAVAQQAALQRAQASQQPNAMPLSLDEEVAYQKWAKKNGVKGDGRATWRAEQMRRR